MNAVIAEKQLPNRKIPDDKYSIWCVEDLTKESDGNRCFMFRLLMKKDQYFHLIHAQAEIPKYFKGVIIAIDNTGEGYPKIYWVNDDDTIHFGGGLRRKPHYTKNAIAKIKFAKVLRYSFKNSDVTELGSDVPNMIKELSEENDANVFAYFEFKK